MPTCAVLHVTSLLGGGVDRHVRDIARSVPRRHFTWHAGEHADVIEIVGESRFVPLDGAAIERKPELLAHWLRDQSIGIVHAHSVSRPVRARAAWAMSALGVRCIATLHDILFLRRDAFEGGAAREADPRWLAETAPFLQQAAALIAPSDYLADMARRHLDHTHVDVVPNGSDRPAHPRASIAPRAELGQHMPRHVVGVLGAIGPHKGREMLEELAGRLGGTGIAIVVIGYLDNQVLPGWRGDHLFIHGTYDDADVAALLAAYGIEVGLFPNQVPESFSYALSDVWSAGVPALVAPAGALAERVKRHDGGWLLPEGFDAADIDQALRRLFSREGSDDLARVRSHLAGADSGRVPSLDSMARSLDALYARFGIETPSPIDANAAPVQELLAKNLDGSLFRAELARLADEVVQMKSAFEGSLAFEREQARRHAEESKQWIAKLEADIAALRAEVEREFDARTSAERASGELEAKLAERDSELGELRPVKRAFDLLPRFVRRLLMKMAHARS